MATAGIEVINIMSLMMQLNVSYRNFRWHIGMYLVGDNHPQSYDLVFLCGRIHWNDMKLIMK